VNRRQAAIAIEQHAAAGAGLGPDRPAAFAQGRQIPQHGPAADLEIARDDRDRGGVVGAQIIEQLEDPIDPCHW
jgi:hypothetical protein